MDTTHHIKSLTKLYILLLVAYFVASYSMEHTLPPALLEFQEAGLNDLSPLGIVGVWSVLALMGIHFGALFGLITEKRWGKPGFLFSIVGLYISTLFWGPVVNDAVSGTIADLADLVTGAIAALLIYTRTSYGVGLPPEETHSAYNG